MGFPMRHRHLNEGVPASSVAAVDSVFERGSYDDIRSFLARICAEPYGEEAEAALTASRHSDVYGWPSLTRLWIQDARRAHPVSPSSG